MTKQRVVAAVGVVAVIAAWYAFRPERLFGNGIVDEAFPSAQATAADPANRIRSGQFHSVAHETQGTAAIYERASGGRVLRFTGFETSNGPDLLVYLVGAPDADDNDTVTEAGFVSLGGLKGHVGDQNYEIPADVDLSEYGAVTIWCRRFGVNFGTAPLTGPATR